MFRLNNKILEFHIYIGSFSISIFIKYVPSPNYPNLVVLF